MASVPFPTADIAGVAVASGPGVHGGDRPVKQDACPSRREYNVLESLVSESAPRAEAAEAFPNSSQPFSAFLPHSGAGVHSAACWKWPGPADVLAIASLAFVGGWLAEW